MPLPTDTVGVFARADHPLGWGLAGRPDEQGHHEQGHRAHGYVVLFVRCADEDELEIVRQRLFTKPFYGLADAGTYYGGNLREWFGGRFDLIAIAPAVDLPYATGRFQCRGDNRMVGVYEAAEVLAKDVD